MELNELYTLKGQLITQIEVAQVQLQDVNRQIVEQLNKPQRLAEDKAEPAAEEARAGLEHDVKAGK